MRIAIGCDHRGVANKDAIGRALRQDGHEVLDMGCDGSGAADYPDHAFAVGEAVAAGEAALGVLICGSGIGVCIAANKVRGVRAALCWSEAMAETTRRHNDSNVICFSGDQTPPDAAVHMTRVWLRAAFEGGRHARRVQKIVAYERGGTPPQEGTGT